MTSPTHTIVVANLAPDATPIDVENMFNFLGNATNVQMRTIKQPHSNQVKYIALVDFPDELSGGVAMSKMDGSPHWPAMPGERIDMHWANKFKNGYTLKVINLPPHTTDDDVRNFFSTVSIPKNIELDADGGGALRTECWAFVEFEEKETAQQVMLMLNGNKFGDRTVHIDWADEEDVNH